MDTAHQLWNDRQKQLRTALKNIVDIQTTMNIFLIQHAWVHDSGVSGFTGKTFSDAAWEEVSIDQARMIPAGGEHSIVWLVWHMARIEDATMNVLVAGGQQVFYNGDWQVILHSPFVEIGNAMTCEERTELSRTVDVKALREYRAAVGRQTREMVRSLTSIELQRKPSASQLGQLLDAHTVAVNWQGPLEYWGNLTVAGLLLMPPTRHNLIHLNEMEKIKSAFRKFKLRGQ